MKKPYLGSELLAFCFSYRLPVLFMSIFIFIMWVGHTLDLEFSVGLAFLLPAILTFIIAYMWISHLIKLVEKDADDKFNCLCKSLEQLDYWYYYGMSAVGVDVSSQRLCLISANNKVVVVSLSEIIEVKSTVTIPDICYSRSVQLTDYGEVIESRSISNRLSDNKENEERRIEAQRNTGLIFDLDKLNVPSVFITMREEDIPSWNRCLKHLSENKLPIQTSPQYFPNNE
ncbi:hypothetical protein [Photobacterium leiognathi]|uniref:hypothetical protein n=1 Tax=Photobacterium leiognathi TaxID=553611 RepID=UPI002739E5B2|nr:hypothetical protein [Photobacterium leiognathi]